MTSLWSRRIVDVVRGVGGYRLVILIGEDFLTTLAASHTILLLLSQFRRGQLLLPLSALDLVAHGIELLLLLVVLLRRAVGPAALTLPPSCVRKESFCHLENSISEGSKQETKKFIVPITLLSSDVLDSVNSAVVSDDDDTTLELLDEPWTGHRESHDPSSWWARQGRSGEVAAKSKQPGQP